MTIIIQHIATGNEYILLGTSLNENKSLISARFLDNFFASEADKPVISMVTACDAQGKIVWLNAAEVMVIEIDGNKPSELLAPIVTPTSPAMEDTPGNPPASQMEDEDFPEDEDWL